MSESKWLAQEAASLAGQIGQIFAQILRDSFVRCADFVSHVEFSSI